MKQNTKLTKDQLQELESFRDNSSCDSTELKRIQAIILLEENNSEKLIPKMTGYSRCYAFSLRRKYYLLGLEGLKTKKKKARSLLASIERESIVRILFTKTPREFGYPADHWTATILGNLIKERFGVEYKSKKPLYLIFKESRFTYHKPSKQYRNRKQEVIDQWHVDKTAEIQAAMQDPDIVVLTGDEMFLSTETTVQKVWLPIGIYPKIDVSNKRNLRCIYGFLNVKTGQEHAFKTLRADSIESCKVLDLLGSLYKGKKIMLLWDNAPWHRSAKTKEFLSTTTHSFRLIQFPPYAPEINPQEHVWKAGRTNVTHNTFIANIDSATNDFIDYLNTQTFNYKLL